MGKITIAYVNSKSSGLRAVLPAPMLFAHTSVKPMKNFSHIRTRRGLAKGRACALKD